MDSVNTMSVINSWITSEAKVLEFGPANGRLTKHLKYDRKCDVTIVEIDEEAGREASQYATNAYLGEQQGNVNNFYWFDPLEKYDYIIFADVLEHLPNPQTILEKCKEMLSPQGAILISIPNIAHNSILIDLYNDEFNYSLTGLLDKTHIHFFTYHSLWKMVSELGLIITKQQPIFSQVGWNEISNSYNDVPFEIERLLRQRKSGSIYQYVFCLQLTSEYKYMLTFSEIDTLPNNFRDEEVSCFVWKDKSVSDNATRIHYVYSNDEKEHLFRFVIGYCVQKIRLDLMETSGIVKINQIKIKALNAEAQGAYIIDHNAAYNIANIFLFTDTDPWLELAVEQLNDACLEYVEVQFQILDNHLCKSKNDIYLIMLKNISEFINNGEYTNPNAYLQFEYTQHKKEFLESQTYIGHLENDMEEQKKYIDHLENDMEEQKRYIDHLEKDLSEQKEIILRQENSILEQNEYIAHLEKDIAELKKFIEQNERTDNV